MEPVVSWLVRLYPPSWRKRYGAELESLVHDTPGRLGVALDLLIGAAIAYRDVIGANRVLSAAGAYLHGLSVAVLLQAIVFVSLVLAGQGSRDPVELRLGPIDFATVTNVVRYHGGLLSEDSASVWVQRVALPLAVDVAVLAILVAMLAAVVATPRLLRRLK